MTSKILTSTESIRKHYFRNKFTTRIPIVHISTASMNKFSTSENRQNSKNSGFNNQQPLDIEIIDNKSEAPIKLYEIQEAIAKHKNSYSTTTPATTRLSFTKISTSPRPFSVPKVTTPFPLTTQRIILKRPQPQTFEEITETKVRKKVSPYDYNEDDFTGFIGDLPAQSKVIVHSGGSIQCLDQGNFPHPVSCRKFISCAKMETGKVVGWEYTCPKNLSFDPVGGICNWSADLGCDE